MASSPSERLRELHLSLPPPAPPLGSYAPVVVERGLAWVSGQIVTKDGRALHAGSVDQSVDVTQARELARLATLQGLGALAATLGSIDRVRRIVRVAVYVSASPGFVRPHEVADGASDLLVEVFGEAGRPARVAMGVWMLPLGAPVEVELTAAVE
jgi:enamine deaminase RidA (YjgF/YER057c/UK114 family)